MTAYNGSFKPTLGSDGRRQLRWQSTGRKENGSSVSFDQVHGGTYSLRVYGGGYHDIFYGCDAGSITITIWVYPSAIGKCAIQILDGPTLMGETFNIGAGAWEQLSVTFTANKKVYIVRLINFDGDGEVRTYFDDLI
jgi:hypothetical protein